MENQNQINPYSKPSPHLENYKKRLEQRNNSQEWIFGNVFGKPGGGAPLRDKSGKIISKRKTIADGNIDRLNPEEFSKGDNNVLMINHHLNYLGGNNFDNLYNLNNENPTFQFQNNNFNYDFNFRNNNLYDINNSNNNNFNNVNFNNFNNGNFNNFNNGNFNNFNNGNFNYPINGNNNIFNKTSPDFLNNENLQFMQNNMINNNNFYPNENYKTDNNWYINQFKNNPYNIPVNFIMPFPVVNPYINQNNNNLNFPNENFNNNNFPNQNNLNNSDNNNNVIKAKTENIQNQEENGYYYFNTQSYNEKDKIKQQKEIEKENWKKELLKQIEDKKKRDEEEKKKNEALDKEEEIKYQEYLQLKKKQHEQQELKRKNNLSKKMQMVYGESNLNDNINNNNQVNDFSYSNINENENNVTDRSLNNNEEEIKNEKYSLVIPKEELKQKEDFKNLIDNHFQELKDDFTKELDEQIRRINNQKDSKYIPYDNNTFEQDKLKYEYQEKKMERIKDLLEQKHLIDYIIGKKDDNIIKFNHDDLKVPIPSTFGINRDNLLSKEKNNNLHSISNFVVNDYRTLNEDNLNDNDIDNNFIYQKQNYGFNNNLIDYSMSISQSLDNKSSFVPINDNRVNESNNNKIDENENKDNEKLMRVIPKNNENEENNCSDLFKKLDEIGKLSKNINPTSKISVFNSSNKINQTKDKYKNFDYDEEIFDIKSSDRKDSKNNIKKVENIQKLRISEKKKFDSNRNLYNKNSENNISSNENERLDTVKKVKKLFNGNIVSSNSGESDNSS